MNAKLSSSHILILAFCLFFALGSLLLFWQNDRERDPAAGKNWWLVAFTDPANQASLDFRVENYTATESFTYRVLRENTALEERTLDIPRGTAREITVSVSETAPTTIEVIHENERKSIYRR